MKNIFLLITFVLLLGACGSGEKKNDAAADKTPVSLTDLTEVTVNVEGMTCEGCENAIKKSIGSLEGIAEVAASHMDSIAVVKFDASKTSIEAIEAKIADAGYTVVKQ